MTYEEMIAEEKRISDEMEANETFRGFKVSDLRKVFEKVQNKENWKLEWAASVPYQIVSLTIAAVVYFHADTPTLHGIEPLTGNVLMSGKGYQA